MTPAERQRHILAEDPGYTLVEKQGYTFIDEGKVGCLFNV